MVILTNMKIEIDDSNLPRYFTNIWRILQELETGELILKLPGGKVFHAKGTKSGPIGEIEIMHEEFFSRLVREGDNGFSEMYLDGWWKTNDLLSLLEAILSNNDTFGIQNLPGTMLVRYYEKLRHWFRTNSKFQAKRNIAYHYDLGNNFYEKWLDETMTYSSAVFETGKESLSEAQNKKYSIICKWLNLQPGYKVLEIGCGWGGFAEYAIKNHGVKVTGLTISKAQHEFSNRRLSKLGLSESAEILLRDYRDERGNYDAIASIEMFEAVGEKYWPSYFQIVKDCLKAGSKATLQIITISDELFPTYRKNVDFIQKYIFPGGMLPSQLALKEQIDQSGLKKLDSLAFGKSYSKTLRMWHTQFNSVWNDISPLGFDERFRRMWNFYFASCAAVFQSGTGDVTQFTLTRPEY